MSSLSPNLLNSCSLQSRTNARIAPRRAFISCYPNYFQYKRTRDQEVKQFHLLVS